MFCMMLGAAIIFSTIQQELLTYFIELPVTLPTNFRI